MHILLKIMDEIKHPKRFVHKLYGLFLDLFAPCIGDRLFLKLKWKHIMGYPLDLEHPKTFNEKLQWLKLYDRNPEYTKMVDKIEAKKYVASIIGEEYIIPTLAVYDDVDEIDFDKLPNQFVLKCSHDSGGVVICKDKLTFDKQSAINKLHKGLKTKFFYQNREWPYKNVKPRLLAEQYMEDETGELRDYKFFCFKGQVKALFIASDRTKSVETKFDFFDEYFNHLPFTNGHPNAAIQPIMPVGFDEMKRLASVLSKGLTHVRVDFYEIHGRIYFGELTFFHWSGLVPFDPEEWDLKLGGLIQLPVIEHDEE